MKYAMDVKVNLRPVFSNLVHSDYWEGPCRVGPEETGTPEYERRLGKEEIKQWYDELKANIDQTRCNIMEPVYIEFNESFVTRDSEFEKLLPENHEVDIYLTTRRSSILPLVQEPMTTWSILISPTSSIVCVFSGRCGNAMVGFNVLRSIVNSCSYSASSSAS